MAPRPKTGYRAGDEVDARCGRCKLELAHTVIAVADDRIARVRCNTCMGEHGYRGVKSASERTATRRRAAVKAAPPTRSAASDFETLIQGRDLSRAEKYSPRMTLSVGDAVDHPKFGLGVVTEIKDGGKAHIAFPAGGRILVFGR